MTAPAFEEFNPASDCDCPGCAQGRRAGPRPSPGRTGGSPAACGIVVVAAASAVLGAAAPAAALTPGRPAEGRPHIPGDEESDTPQGPPGPLYGPAGAPAKPETVPLPTTTRTKIINRAKVWVTAQVPYSMSAYWSDGYRQDCSGYVSMAWGLPSNEWTGSLDQFGVKITKNDLQPGDILLYHNPDNPEQGSHVVIFGGWTDYTHTYYTVYEQTPPHARSQPTPYPYWSNADKYVPYRYKGLVADAAGGKSAGHRTSALRPGAVSFGLGAGNPYVTRFGEMWVARGGRSAPVPAVPDRAAARAVPAAYEVPRAYEVPPARGVPAAYGVPGYPGRGHFRPGAENAYVTQLRRRLVEKGFGRFYADAPGPRWGDADRRAVEAFQRAQGWRGGAADGYPGPETWRRLFEDADPEHVTGL
ncbi:hypothetical protein BFF78_26265 [Streptomyces fodineus]|uniref:NlpC/P60 domain-containing protein n=1 Tax=Streptomyces fodineus TaxID=1904616 RepID=A0A1D7YEZ8_9ACTN|nr:peptidoglycan-binding protein [Streptomyces fodineus]AOR34090.1 hypothetical protein BFF78_26265 [Streptomyces fodineus]